MINGSPVLNITDVSKLNKAKLLRLIRERKTISRADIVKETGITAPTVSRLVDSLITKERLVVEIGQANVSRGRPPSLLQFAGDQHYIIGIDVGQNHIRGVFANLNGEVQTERERLISPEIAYETAIQTTAELIDEILSSVKVPRDRPIGVGAAVRGLVDRERGRIVYSAAFGWRDKDFARELSRMIHLPVICDHSVRVMAQGELWYGHGHELRDFICVDIGSGIGAAFILNGQLYVGRDGMVCEFGHVTFNKDSTVPCTCGNYGCLESLAGGRAIAEAARRGLPSHPDSTIVQLCGGDSQHLTAAVVAEAANQGDAFAKHILKTAAEYIGIGIAALINLHHPQAIIIGGGLIQAGEFFWNEIHENVHRRVLNHLADDVDIRIMTHGTQSRLIGAVALILNEVLNLNVEMFG